MSLWLWFKDKYYQWRGYIPVNFCGYRIYITKKMKQEICVPSIDEIVSSKPIYSREVQWWKWVPNAKDTTTSS